MKGHQLKTLREERNLTQAQLAEFLGDTTAGTVSKWEKDVHAIPQWVSDKMLTSAAVTLPLEALRHLLNYANEKGITFEELLAQAIRAYQPGRGIRPASPTHPQALTLIFLSKIFLTTS